MNRLVLLIAATILVAPGYARTLQKLDAPHMAPGFELPSIDGGSKRFEDYRGRYLLVNFWAVWCAPCRAEMPAMERLYEKYAGDDFEVLAIHVGPSTAGAKRYAESQGLKFPILVDEEMALSDWAVKGLPTTYLIDPQGRIVAQTVGELQWDAASTRRTLERLLGRTEQPSPDN